MNAAVPALASAISFLFAAIVLQQYLARRRPYQLVWALGFLFWGLGTGAEAAEHPVDTAEAATDESALGEMGVQPADA